MHSRLRSAIEVIVFVIAVGVIWALVPGPAEACAVTVVTVGGACPP